MDNITTIIVAIISSSVISTIVLALFQRRKTNAETEGIQASITLQIQNSLKEAISIYECRIDRYEERIAALEKESEAKDKLINVLSLQRS